MTTGTAETLAATVADLGAIGLDEAVARAAADVRLTRKYFVPADLLPQVVAELADTHDVLDIDGLRVFDYRSVYFDDPGLASYHAHVQGRRRRFKIRTRAYLDTATCALELKLNGVRGRTEKLRTGYRPDDATRLTDPGRSFLVATLRARYDATLPGQLAPSLTTEYRRATLVAASGGSRVTVDVDLVCGTDGRTVRAREGHVLVETKSDTVSGPADRTLRRHGVRPVPMSKYCLGLAALRPDLVANPWHATMRRYFVVPTRHRAARVAVGSGHLERP